MPRLKTEETCNVSIRLPTALLERIDQSASHHGMTRTAYMLSWLPDQHERNAATAPNANGNKAR